MGSPFRSTSAMARPFSFVPGRTFPNPAKPRMARKWGRPGKGTDNVYGEPSSAGVAISDWRKP